MRKLKLFPKIFIYTLSILGTLVAIAHLFLYFAFPHFYLQERQQELSRKADILVESLSQVDEQGAASALQVYAKNEGITAYLKKESTGENLQLGTELPIDENSSQNSVIIEDRQVTTKDGKQMQLQVVTTTESVKQATKVTFSYLPLSLAISIVTAVIFSYIYARKLSKPLMQMSRVTQKMMELDRDARFVNPRSDEIGQMETQINELYEHLLSVIDELEEKNQKMIQLEKTKVNFLRSASHELKTPLASLRILLENMSLNVGKYKDRDTYLAESIGKVDQMSDLVQEILELSKLQEETLTKEPIALEKVLPEWNKEFQLLSQEKGLKIQTALEPLTIEANPIAFRNVWNNLLMNAIKHSTREGVIQIELTDEVLSIKNPCMPLTKEQIETAFSLLPSSKGTTGGGNGVGLYSVHQLLKREGISHHFFATEDGMCFEMDLKTIS